MPHRRLIEGCMHLALMGDTLLHLHLIICCIFMNLKYNSGVVYSNAISLKYELNTFFCYKEEEHKIFNLELGGN